MKDVIKDYVAEVVKATPAYAKKEQVREQLQSVIVSSVAAGEVKEQKDLDDLFKTVEMALSALKMVPLGAYKALAKR